MRTPRRGAGDREETSAPALPAAPRPYALAPSLALPPAASRARAPRHAVPAKGQRHRPESRPLCGMRRLQEPGQGYTRRTNAHSDWPNGGETSRFLFPFPAKIETWTGAA